MVDWECFEVRQLGHPWPGTFGGGTKELEYPLQLVINVRAGEKWTPSICQFYNIIRINYTKNGNIFRGFLTKRAKICINLMI
jgi:hypothetical protein